MNMSHQQMEQQVLFCEMKVPTNVVHQLILLFCLVFSPIELAGCQIPLSSLNCLVYFKDIMTPFKDRWGRGENCFGNTTEFSQVGWQTDCHKQRGEGNKERRSHL